jgi:hypothetical protein
MLEFCLWLILRRVYLDLHSFGVNIATSQDKYYNEVHILLRFISATSSGDKDREQCLIYNYAVFS